MRATTDSTVFYYFGFPHYRKEILTELERSPHINAEFVSGSTNRSSIAVLSAVEFPALEIVGSVQLGPMTWDRGVVKRLRSTSISSFVVGPALSSLSTWALLGAAKLSRKRVYLWGQCGRLGDRSPRRYLQEAMNRLSDGLLVYGDAEARAAAELGTPVEKIHIVRNATSANRNYLNAQFGQESYARLRENISALKNGEPASLVFVGRMTPDKRLDVLLESVRTIQKSYPNLVLKMVGDGPARGSLERACSDTKVEYLGWVYDRDELQRVFQSTIAAVSPYHMGLLAVDAVRFGVPVLVPDNPMCGSEVECLSPGVNSVQFNAGDAGSLADSFERLVKTIEEGDEGRYLEARRSALTIWDPESVADTIARVISSENSGDRD